MFSGRSSTAAGLGVRRRLCPVTGESGIVAASGFSRLEFGSHRRSRSSFSVSIRLAFIEKEAFCCGPTFFFSFFFFVI